MSTEELTTSPARASEAPLRRVLVIDDNSVDRLAIIRALRKRFGAELAIGECDTAAAALLELAETPVDVVLVDYLLPDLDGLEVVRTVTQEFPGTARILMSGQGNETVATQAMKRGAQDYLIKRDLSPAALELALTQAVRAVRLEREHARLFDELCRARQETTHLVRALSHDLGAMFRMLEVNLRQLRQADAVEDAASREEIFLHVDAIVRESRHFLDDLVTLGKTGAIDMEPAEVDLHAAADEVVFEQMRLIEEHGVVVKISDDLPKAWCNQQRVKQIFTNLLRNAIRHGRGAEPPMIKIGAWRPAADDVCWIGVADNGPGIPATARQEIFLPGRRLASADAEGSGMGLAIVKKIVEHYGGRIYVDPQYTDGAALVFSLPTARVAKPAAQAAVRQLAGAMGQLSRSLKAASTPLPEAAR